MDGAMRPPPRVSVNMLIEFAGETKTLREWAEARKISARALTTRLYKGWSIEKALSTGHIPRELRGGKIPSRNSPWRRWNGKPDPR